MGGRTNTVNEPAHKELLDKLNKNAQEQLKAKGIYVNDTTTLDDRLNLLAGWHFHNSLGYSFNDTPDECHPPRLIENGKVRPLAKLCSMKTNDISAGNIERYIRTTMIAEAKVPKRMQDRALQDLVSVAQALLAQPVSTGTNEWQKDRYMRTFEPTPEEELLNGNQTAVQVDGILLYCNAYVKSGNDNAQLCVLYYMSTYYDVASEMTMKRGLFQDNAFKDAQPFTRSAYPIKSESDLAHALETHSSTLFKDHFVYDYGDKPPSLAKGFSPMQVGRRFTLGTSHATSFRQEDWLSNFAKTYVEPLNFRDTDMRASAAKDLGKDLINFAQKHNTATWSIQYFDRMYDDPAQPRANASRFSGVVLYFCTRGTTPQDHDVSVTFVSILSIFYETMPIKQAIMGDLLSDLCRIIPNQDKLGYIFDEHDTRTLPGIHALTLECASQHFHKTFQLDWSRIHTIIAEPNQLVEAYEVLFDMNTNLSIDAIEDEVERQVFPRDGLIGSTTVPDPIVNNIFDDLVRRITRMAESVTSMEEVNQWHMESFKRSFGSEDRIVTHYAVFLYVFGEQSLGSVSVRQFFLQYLSIFVEVRKE